MTMRSTTEVNDPSRQMDEKGWWDLWNTSYRAAEDLDPVADELMSRAAAEVNRITGYQGSRVLEVACGSGCLSRLIRYSNYHGLDISPAAVEIARRKAASMPVRPGVVPPTYEAADFHQWPSRPEAFDVVVCVDAISSIRDQEIAMKKMVRSLRPGGSLVLTTINAFVYHRIKRTNTQPLASGPVCHWLHRSKLRQLIQSAGFVIERLYTIMPRGNAGILRLINSGRLDRVLTPRGANALRQLKERAGLGQYFVVVARKPTSSE